MRSRGCRTTGRGDCGRRGRVAPFGRACSRNASPRTQAAAHAAPKVSMVPLGCPKNTVDGEVLLGDLQSSGFTVTHDHDDSDTIIVNTCGFIEDAKTESITAILEAARKCANKPGKKLVVTGCLAQRYAEELADLIPEVDLLVGFENYPSLPSRLSAALGNAAQPAATVESRSGVQTGSGGGPAAAAPGSAAAAAAGGGVGETGPGADSGSSCMVAVGGATVPFRPEATRFRLTPPHTAYLRVAEGCSHSCTFCAIPSFRGTFRSKPWASVVEEARALVAAGVKELNLIAEDTNQYGMDRRDGSSLAHLLRELASLEGLQWMRILYAYPSYFTDDLIDEIAQNPKVCKYIDMPLQHISNFRLLAMNRPPRAHTEALLHKLRQRIPGLALRTTFICGFPGETSTEHRELLDFCKTFKFARMGAFVYSEEEDTPAALLPNKVADDVKIARRDELVSVQQRISERWAKKRVGTVVKVLVDGTDDDGNWVGRTEFDAPDIDNVVFLEENADVEPLQAGQMRNVCVTDHVTFDLIGHPV